MESLAQQGSRFSPEFRLALDCCRACFARGTDSEIAPATDLDWAAFLRLVQFHRIEGLAWDSLRRAEVPLPADITTELGRAAAEIAAESLSGTAECQALLEQFNRASVPLLFLKGLTLGALAYGNAAVKSAIDIDLLIDPGDLGEAAGLLRQRGFRLTAPRESRCDAALHSWHRLWKESVWTKDSPRLQIDLHTRAADNRRLIPSIDAHSPRQVVDVGNGIRLPTLATEQLFAYLAVHGASSAWFRLKWISDFAGMLHGFAGEELERLYVRSQELGAGRAPGLALILADHLSDTLQSAPGLRKEVGRDKAVQRLLRISLGLLTSGPIEPTERRWGTLPIHRTQFALLPGSGFKFSELSRQLRQTLTRLG